MRSVPIICADFYCKIMKDFRWFLGFCLFSELMAEDISTVLVNNECLCGENQYCIQKSCRACPPNSISKPGSEKIQDCLCNPGYSWEIATEGKKNIVCTKCLPRTYKQQQGNQKCQICPANTFSPMGSTHEDNCTQTNLSMPKALSFKEQLTTASKHRESLIQRSNHRRRNSRYDCCPGSYVESSFKSGWGLQIEIIGNETTTSRYPLKHNFSLFSVSADGEFALGLMLCIREDGLICSSSIHKINMNTFEDVLIAGNRAIGMYDIANFKGIDGPGPNATFLNWGSGDIAIAANGSYALLVDSDWIRRIDLYTYDVTTICSKYMSAMSFDMSPDGAFALVGTFMGGLKMVDLATCQVTAIPVWTSYSYKHVRILSNSNSAIFFTGECQFVKVSLESNDYTVLAGDGCNEIHDGIGQSAGFGQLEGLALFPEGNQAIFIERSNMQDASKPGPLYIRRLDLDSLAVTTLSIIDDFLGYYSPIDAHVIWRPCPAGTFSLAGASSCQPCPQGTFQDKAGSSSCESCSQWRPCLPPLAPRDGPCELPHLTWPLITMSSSGVWTGGLGTLMTQEVQVWACLFLAEQPDMCSTPGAETTWPWDGPAAACYVYNERTKQFAYWGTNHVLRLVKW